MYFDCHCHTVNSDGIETVAAMCQAAYEKGMPGLTITDHCDMNFYHDRDHYNRIRKCIDEIYEQKEIWAGKLEVLCGVEMGEYLYDAENADKVLAFPGYDCILNSVHLVPEARFPQPYNRIPFSEDGTDEEIVDYLKKYLELLDRTVDSFDFDVLAHISCPVRYMTGKHSRKADMMQFEPLLRKILQKIIDRNIGLEINSGGLNPKFQYCNVQNEEIFSLYKSMGGNMPVLGSDAHRPQGLCNGFDTNVELLKKLGFSHYYYFKNRKPVAVEL